MDCALRWVEEPFAAVPSVATLSRTIVVHALAVSTNAAAMTTGFHLCMLVPLLGRDGSPFRSKRSAARVGVCQNRKSADNGAPA